MDEQKVELLVVLVVAGSQASNLMNDLQQEKFSFTVIDTSGGIVNETMTCLILGLPQNRLPLLIELARKHCQSYLQYIPAQMRPPGELMMLPMVEAQLGGALMYMMDVERFEQF